MNILLIGSGGREHALAWKIAQSSLCGKLYCAPGNAGIAQVAQCVDMGAEDLDVIEVFVQDHQIDFVIVGPEGPLVLGLADRIAALDVPVFGPSKAAAALEGSKGFMKDLCAKYDIPTARYGRFTDFDAAKVFLEDTYSRWPVVVKTAEDANYPSFFVIKTDGLAAGKGVIIEGNLDSAIETVEKMLSGETFGDSGKEVVIEDFLMGEELSYFAICDGTSFVPFGSAQDHKRACDGDLGPNTGGMGAYSPAHLMTPELEKKIIERLIQPTIDGMAAEGCPFVGVLFAGIMVVKGEPILLEHNARFGDPECQTLMMRFEGDLVALLLAAAKGDLNDVRDKIRWRSEPALCVVMAAGGYPGEYKKNILIKGLENIQDSDDVVIFHAATEKDEHEQFVSTGGRVLGVTALGTTITEARDSAYKVIEDHLEYTGLRCRKDIAYLALRAEKNKKP